MFVGFGMDHFLMYSDLIPFGYTFQAPVASQKKEGTSRHIVKPTNGEPLPRSYGGLVRLFTNGVNLMVFIVRLPWGCVKGQILKKAWT